MEMGIKMENVQKGFLILIVDDNPDNIKVVGNHLRNAGHEISIAMDGKKAMQIAKSNRPDLILLDIMMPGTNGLELCSMLKNDESTKEIPVIFLTAKIDDNDIIEGFNVGAVDYIKKPFNSAELLARINTHLELKHYRDQINHKNIELQKLSTEKSELLGITAHDLKNPIYSISMLAKVIKNEKSLSHDDIDEFAGDIIITAERMLELISNLLDLNKIEQGDIELKLERVNLNELAIAIIDIYEERAKRKRQVLTYSPMNKDVYVFGDRNALVQIYDNLISNAIKYSPSDKNISVIIQKSDTFGRLTVKDEGPGLTDDDQKKLFRKFSKLSARPTGDEDSTGLGLSIVKRYVDLMDGNVMCKSTPGNGADFIVDIPLA